MKQKGVERTEEFLFRTLVRTLSWKTKAFYLGYCPLCKRMSSSIVSEKHAVRSILRHMKKKHGSTRKAA